MSALPLVLVSFLLGWAPPGSAVEYRLLAANLQEEGFGALMGAVGHGNGEVTLTRLETALDSGAFPRGPLLHRPLRVAPASLARGFQAAPVLADVQAGEEKARWMEVRWEGRPGERSVWIIEGTGIQHYGEVYHLGLGPAGSVRYFIPSGVAVFQRRGPALGFSLQFIDWRVGRGDFWSRYLARTLDMPGGIGAVIGVNDARHHSDYVYLVVEHPTAPTTFKAIVGWRRRPDADNFIQSPGGPLD
jgi:hypothetical protein